MGRVVPHHPVRLRAAGDVEGVLTGPAVAGDRTHRLAHRQHFGLAHGEAQRVRAVKRVDDRHLILARRKPLYREGRALQNRDLVVVDILVRSLAAGHGDLRLPVAEAVAGRLREGRLRRQCRIDPHIAVRHLEGHIRVCRVRVAELPCAQSHVGRAHRGAGGRRAVALVAHAVHVIRLVAGRQRVPRDGVCAAVVVGHEPAARHGHHHLVVDRADGHIAVGHREGHGAEVRVGVRELLCGQAHVGRAHGGSGSLH